MGVCKHGCDVLDSRVFVTIFSKVMRKVHYCLNILHTVGVKIMFLTMHFRI